MLEGAIQHSIAFIVFLCVAIAAHELGHLWAINSASGKGNYKIVWSFKQFLRNGDLIVIEDLGKADLSDDERVKIYISGIFAGLIVVLIAGAQFSHMFLFLLSLYLYGCKHDIKQILKIKGSWREVREMFRDTLQDDEEMS